MAFRRRGRRLRRPKRSNYVKKFAGYAGLAAKAWTLAKYLKGLINVERKFLDVETSAAAVSKTTGSTTWISSISEGTDYNQRTGISVKLTSLFIRGTINMNTTATQQSRYVRFIVFMDSDPVSATPAMSDVFEVAGDPNSPLNHTNGARFKILHDKLYSISLSGPDNHIFKKYIKLSHHLRWGNSTTDRRAGHIYVMAFSDTDTAAEEPLVGWYSRLRFVDN